MALPDRKRKVLKMFLDCLTKYHQIIFVDLLNISTPQIVKIRQKLHKSNGIFLVGKNTITILALKILTEKLPDDSPHIELQKKYGLHPELKNLMDKIKNKVAFIFTEVPFSELKEPIEKEVVKVPAKVGILAPDDVWVRAGPTTIDPGKFGDFQRLGIQTKTARNALEIQKDAKICAKGEVVTETVSAMCRMLNIIPFEYGMKVQDVYLNGNFIPHEVINLPPGGILTAFQTTLKDLAAISVETHLINELSVPHLFNNTMKSILGLALGGGIKHPLIDSLSAAPKAAPAPAKAAEEKKPAEKEKGGKEDKKKKEEKKEEPVEEEMGIGDMFG